MEHVERCAHFLRVWVVRSSVRRTMPWGILSLMLGGSFLKWAAPLPDSYLSDKRNVLNVYFVKFAWGWTLFLLLPFISLTNYSVAKNLLVVLRRLSGLLVASAVWYVCTGIFLHIEDMTGNCYKSSSHETLLQEYSSKVQCHRGGGVWNGFDISGHSFLLSYCTLIILEEMAVMHTVNASLDRRLRNVIDSLFLALCGLSIVWGLMLLTTAVYFHDFSQKLLGTLVGLLFWYGTYRFWYLRPFSPGLPPQSTNYRAQKFNHRL